jgi:predicted ribosomally synthesized peptide with SipW-like signal peptide
VFLLVGALQGFAIGLTGLLRPAHIVGFPLLTTPLNARFAASFYLAGAIGLTLSAMRRRAWHTRALVTAFGFVTLLLLVVTLAYWSDFTVKGVPYAWLISYIIDPVGAAIAVVTLKLYSKERPRTDALGALFLAETLACAGVGVLLLAAPEAAVDVWPWHLTIVLARVYGSIFLALGLAAALCSQERQRPAIVPFAWTSLIFASCSILCYGLHSSRFSGDLSTAVWLAANGAAAAAFALVLVRSRWRVGGAPLPVGS